MPGEKRLCDPDGWARLRFAIIGPVLADPPPSGELGARLRELTAKDWRHPLTGLPLRFGFATLESSRAQARATLGGEFPICALSVAQRDPSSPSQKSCPRIWQHKIFEVEF